MPPRPDPNFWVMHFDGSKVKDGLGAGVVLTSPRKDVLKYVLQIHFAASNNVAEYEALVHGLKVSKEIGLHRIRCYGDSALIVHQSSGEWDALDANMALYRFHVQKISGYFDGCEFFHIARADNEAADELSKLGSSRQAIPPGIALEHLRTPSIKPSPESESIHIPSMSEPEAVPMEIDGANTSAHPGTSRRNPGTAKKASAEAMQIEPKVQEVLPMEIDPGPAKEEDQPMEIDEQLFPVRPIPLWAQPIMDYLSEGKLPEDEDFG